MKNGSKAFKVGKLQKVEKWCFHLIDVGFLILSLLLSLLLTLADIKQHCLVFIWVSWKNKQSGCVYVCGTFIKWTHTKWSWKGVQFNAYVSFPRLPRHLLKADAWNNHVFEWMIVWVSACAALGGSCLLQSCLTSCQERAPPYRVLHNQASRQVLPSASQPVPCNWPGHTQQQGDVKCTVGGNSAVTAASVLALRLGGGWTWEVSWGEAKLKWKRRESEVRKRSRERWMLRRKPCRRLEAAANQHKLTTQSKMYKKLQEQLEAPSADGSVAFPPGWGLVLVAVFPHRPHGRKRNQAWITEKWFKSAKLGSCSKSNFRWCLSLPCNYRKPWMDYPCQT